MAATDQKLTDLDVDRLLTEGVFGGPLPSSERLQQFVEHLTPGAERLVAIQSATLPAAPARSAWLLIHPGIGYLIWRGASPLPRLRLKPGTLIGLSQPIERNLINAIQQALVTLRRRELGDLTRRQREPPTFARECEARAVLVSRLQQGEDWREAWAWWSNLVLVRHQYQINAIRRKLVELVALATSSVDSSRTLSWPFRAFIDLLYGSWALTPLIVAVERELTILAPLIAQTHGRPTPPALSRALAWIHEHLSEAPSLRHAAKAARVTPEHLARLAKSHLGTSLLAHITNLRLDDARRLLSDSDHSVGEVATRCGFTSVEHFQRTFKRVIGTSPGRWRRVQSAQNPNSTTPSRSRAG